MFPFCRTSQNLYNMQNFSTYLLDRGALPMDLLTSVGNQLISACKNQLLNFQEFFKLVDVISVP